MNIERFSNKKIAILGFGIEGQSVCDFLEDSSSQVVVLDERERAQFDEKTLIAYEDRGIVFQLGKIEKIEGVDMVFRSPGFNPNASYLKEAQKNGIVVTSATKVFFELCPCPITGVTGTKGKGTTSTLIYEMLKKQELDAYLGGNIGVPPLSFLSKLTPVSKVVLELSSFQLQDMTVSPHVAVMLMTTQEHLAPDRPVGSNQNFHSDIYDYVDSKRNILRYQTEKDFTVLNKDYPATRESDIYTDGKVYMVSREQDVEQGCFVKDGAIFLKMGDKAEEILPARDIALPGRHNLENACAAIVGALCSGATMKSILPVLKTFKGLEHRIEYVATKRGVKYYDDSFSTTPETAIAAIEAFEEPKILILGGASKNSDFTELGKVISESSSIKAIIQVGAEWSRIKEKVGSIEPRIKVYEGSKSMKDVIQKASEIGEIGDVVILSPACSSFDLFKSYKDRGEQFKKEVNKL